MAGEMNSEMSGERFAAIVEAYGGDARRWPDVERDAALAFVNLHGEIAEPILREARVLDAVLDADAALSPLNDILTARIARSFNPPSVTSTKLDWRPFAALAACAVFGLVVGFGAGRFAPSIEATPSVAQADDHRDAEAAIDAAFGMLNIDTDSAGEGG